MVSLQSALLPEAATTKQRPPCLSLVASTATSKKRKRDGSSDDADDSRGEVVDGIELNFDAAPLPPEWQRCLDIKSGQIHYYNTRTQKRTWKDPRGEPDFHAAEEEEDEAEESANYCAPPGLDLELNLAFEPRRRALAAGHEKSKKKKKKKPTPPRPAAAAALAAAEEERRPRPPPSDSRDSSREMVAAVCVRCHMLVMMCRASPACPNCKFLHPPTPPEPEPPAPLKLGLQLLCCRD